MSLGREVADAYIEVHGDLSPFRRDLTKASGDLQKAAIENSDTFADAWDKNLANRLTSSWDKLVDGLASGRQIDINQMITAFDPTDLDNASAKIHDLLNTMRDAGKITSGQYDDVIGKIDESTKAMQRQAFVEKDLAREREIAAARVQAFMEDNRRNMEEAIRENERWARSFEGINKNANLAAMEADFRKVAEAVRTADFSSFAKGFEKFEDFRARVNEVTSAMREQGRVSREQAFIISDSANMYIDGEERKAQATRDALEAARIARVEADRFKASIEGMVKAAKEMDLEQRFRGLSAALATNDFSGLARGARNMEDLRDRTISTATEMRNLGRMTDAEFAGVQDRLTAVAADMDSYNVRWREATDRSEKHKRDWTIIQTMIGNAGKKFAGFSGLNILTDMFRSGAEFFQNVDRNAVKIGKMSLLMGTAAASIIHAVGGLAVMGQDLAAIGNIGILAPGFLTAAGIGIAVLVSAFKDMGTVLGDLKPQFQTLQDNISAKFWEQAEAPIRSLVDTLFPTLNTQLQNTATSMGGLVSAFASAFEGAATPERVTGMFEKMNAAIDIAKGAMAPLVEAFVTLGEVGSQYFGRFAEWIVQISTDFNNFIQAAAADGRLNTWIETAITNLQAVGSIIGSVVEIFNAIGDAAERAGIGGLSAFAGALERAADVMQSSGFQNTLVMLFSGAEQAAGAVATALFNLGPAISSIMPTISLALVTIGDTMATVIGYIGQIMQNPVVQKGITDFVTGVQTGIEALAPAIGPMGDSLGQIGTILGQVAATLGPLIAAFITGLAPVLDQVTAAFARITFAAGPEILSIIQTLSPMFQQMVDILLPPLENLITTVLPVLSAAFAALAPIFPVIAAALAPVIDAITQLVNQIAPVLIPAIGQIVAAVTPVIEVLGQVVGFILSMVVPILGALLVGVINNVVGIFQGLSNFIMGFVAIVTALFTGFGAFFTKIFQGDIGGALNALGTMFGQIWNGIVQMVSGAITAVWNFIQLWFVGKLVSGVKTALSGIGSFFKSTWDNIVLWVRGAMTNVSNFVNAGITAARNFVTNGLNAIKNFFSTIWNGVVNFVRGAGTNIANGVNAGITAARNFVTNGLNGIKNFFTSAWNGMVSFVSTAWTRISSGVQNGINTAIGFVQGLPGKITSALGDLGGLLLSQGNAIINGFLDGLKGAWGGVTDFVGGIADWIANNKGPLPYDRVLLIPAGEAIMGGLAKGLMNKLGHLKSVLETVTSTMEDSVTAAFAQSKMYTAGANAALGLADGLKANKRSVAAALGSIIPETSGALTVGVSGTGGVGVPTPGNTTIVNVAEGAIPISTPAENPRLVASMVIDEFASTVSKF